MSDAPESTVDSLIPLHDSDIIEIEKKVLEPLNEKQKRRVDLEGFRVEIIERFQSIGLGVQVNVFTTNVPDVYFFEATINSRLEREIGEFDPDRQVHEVTNDLLELGEGGVISTKGIIKS